MTPKYPPRIARTTRRWRWLLLGCLPLLLTSCMLRVGTDDANVEAKVKSLSQIFKENDVNSCVWITGQAGPYVTVNIVLAGRVPLQRCLEARHP